MANAAPRSRLPIRHQAIPFLDTRKRFPMPARLAAVLTISVAACAGAHAQSGAFDAPPAYRVGDRWTFTFIDLFTNRKSEPATLAVVRTGDGKTSFEGKTVEGKPWNYTADAEGNAIYTFQGVGYVNRERDFPLADGKAWTNDRRRAAGQAAVDQTEKCSVGGIETVEVPAGRFQAAKVECRLWWKNNLGSEGNARLTKWYAPAARQWVLIEEMAWKGPTLQTKRRREMTDFAVTP